MNKQSKISQTPLDRDKPHHKGVLFLEGIPKSTKVEFKAACAKRDLTMRDAIILLMRRFISETNSR